MSRPIEVRVTGDSRSAIFALERTEDSIRSLDRTAEKSSAGMGKLKGAILGLGAAGGFLALREGTKLIKESVGLASNLAESTSKVGTIFGKASDGVLAWAKTTDAAMSMSQTAILDTVSSFNLLLTNKGISGKQSLEWSKNLTGLAADLSSFFNVSAQEAAGALTAALKGEMDPIEKFGVSLDEATLKARAYEMGLYKGKGALSATAKAQAAYAEILDQTSDAQGDLIRTSGSAANQMRQFGINVEGLKTTFGLAFTPLIEEYLPGINDWLKSINNEKAAENLGERFLEWAHVLEGDVLPKVKSFASGIKDAFTGVDKDQLSGNLDALKGAASNLGDGVSKLWAAFEGLSPEAKANIATIVAAGATVGLLAKSNPVVRIGVDLVAGAIGTISETLISRMFRGTQNVRVTNFPSVYPDGPDGSDGSGKRPGKGAQVGAGIAAIAALAATYLVDKLPIPQRWKDTISEISKGAVIAGSVAAVATAFGISNPIGWGVGIVAGITALGKKNGENTARINGVKVYAQGLNATVNTHDRKIKIVEFDAAEETKRRRAGDEAEAARRQRADYHEADRRLFGDRTEAAIRRSKDAKLAAEVAGIDADIRAVRAYFGKVERLLSENRAVESSTISRATRVAPVVNQTFSINVSGAGSPAVTARAIDRYIRRAGDPRLASVTA